MAAQTVNTESYTKVEPGESNQPEYDEPAHRLDKETQISITGYGDKR